MQKVTSISTKVRGERVVINFGIASTKKEREEVFKLRYKIYVEKKKYIPAELISGNLEEDVYDKKGYSTHFMAKIGKELVGTLRLISSDPLPIFKGYFSFKEPTELKSLAAKQKIEVGRLISLGTYQGEFLPRHLVMLGLFDCLEKYCSRNGIKGGYGAMKKYIVDKLSKLSFPLHEIKNYKDIYNPKAPDPLKNFFNDPEDPVIPVYFTGVEARRYLDKILKQSLGFKVLAENKYQFMGNIRLAISMMTKRF